MARRLPTLKMGGKDARGAFHCTQIKAEIADMHTYSVLLVLTDL